MLIRCLVTFIVGMGVGFLAAQKMLEKKYADLAQDEIDSVKETFGRTREPIVESITDDDPACEAFRRDMQKEEERVIKERKAGLNSGLTRSSLEGLRENPYEKAKREYNVMGVVTDAAGMTEEDMQEADEDELESDSPYQITSEQFTEECEHHDKVSLYYYRVDDVLSGENEEIIENVEECIGYDALAVLDTQGTVWVRNEELAVDYEVISINKTYAEAVHGMTEESPRERHARQAKNGRRKEGDEK